MFNRHRPWRSCCLPHWWQRLYNEPALAFRPAIFLLQRSCSCKSRTGDLLPCTAHSRESLVEKGDPVCAVQQECTCSASLAPTKGKVKTSWPAGTRPCCLAREGLVVRVCHPHLGNMQARYREAKWRGSPEHKTQEGLTDCYVQNITEQCDVTTSQASFLRSKPLRDGKGLYEVSEALQLPRQNSAVTLTPYPTKCFLMVCVGFYS